MEFNIKELGVFATYQDGILSLSSGQSVDIDAGDELQFEHSDGYVDYLNEGLFKFQFPLMKKGTYYYNYIHVVYFCCIRLAKGDSGVRTLNDNIVRGLFLEAKKRGLRPLLGVCCLTVSGNLVYGLFDPRELPVVQYTPHSCPDRSMCCYSCINKELGTTNIVLKFKHEKCMTLLRSLSEKSFRVHLS